MRSATELLGAHGTRTLQALREFLDGRQGIPPRLREAIDYTLLAGGKRLRPTLVLESFAACGGPTSREPSALAAAGAIELIHTFSLVHDDLPAMDDDSLRRGKPTCHVVYGEALAILTGDALVALAFELIARQADPAITAMLVAELAGAAGAAGMIGGQVLDIAGENQSLKLAELQQIHRLKTGALLTTACRLGALAAGASVQQLDALTAFGRHVGLAFQIIDDLLDITATPQQLGKATNKDRDRGKNTYPALLGMEESKAAALQQLTLALDPLEPLGTSADALADLARFVVERAV